MNFFARRDPQKRDRAQKSRDAASIVSGLLLLGVGVGSVIAGTISTLATVFARMVVTPPRKKNEDVRIYGVTQTAGAPTEIELQLTSETSVPGTYTLVFHEGEGIARIGEITQVNAEAGTVQRRVEEVYQGELSTATRASWTGFLWPTPAHAGFDADEVFIQTELGPAPAWRVAPEPDRAEQLASNTWALMVHGRGAQRTEGIRALRTARALGMTSLLLSYRNDGVAPPAADGRYGLGATEWRDVEAGLKYALDHGADQVVVFGWSMGAAVSLQLADLSAYSQRIRGLVLDGPVINWIDVLEYQAQHNKLPEAVGTLGQWLITNKWGRWLTGLAAPVDLKALDWVDRADELKRPVLIIHSEDDDFVPIGPSTALALKRPDLVSLVRFRLARHTREWNVDPDRWEKAVYAWLSLLLQLPRADRRQLTGN